MMTARNIIDRIKADLEAKKEIYWRGDKPLVQAYDWEISVSNIPEQGDEYSGTVYSFPAQGIDHATHLYNDLNQVLKGKNRSGHKAFTNVDENKKLYVKIKFSRLD